MKRHLLYLLTGFTSLAMPFFVGGSTSTQVEQLGQMAIHRSAHKATALSDGRVLITGGRNTAGIVIADAEIFDPNTDESSAVAPMATARVDHTATLLKDGRVLITGGSNATGTLKSAEIFDPSTGTFSAVSGSMNMARARHTATLLSSGKVLIAGGDVTPTLVDPNGTDVTGTAEMFDPSAGTFGDLVLLQRSRSGHTATLFSNDKVWLAGGGNDTIESFDAAAGAFTLSDTAMTAVRSGHEAFALSSTSVLFFGGDTNHTIDQFNPSTGELSLVDQMNGEASSATLLANGNILVLRSDFAGLYDPAGALIAFDDATMPNSTLLLRSGQSATELFGDKKILVAGGENAQHQPILQIATFNPARIWTDKDDYMPDDPVLLFGAGWKPNENVYLYAVDSETEQWTYESTVAADSNGSFALQPYFIVQLRQLGTMFTVDAVGAQSNMQAEVEFTDAVNLNSISVGPQTGTPVAGTPGSATYQITANYSGNGANNDDPVTLSFVGWTGGTPAGVTASLSPTSVTQGSPNSTLTLQTSASTVVAGTFTFTVRATTAGGQQKNANGTLTISPSAATKLALSGSTGNLTSGATRVLTATIQDANGNTVTSGPNSALSITFAQTSGTGSVTGLDSVNASSGVANITVTGGQPGSVTIAASGGSLAQGAGNPITFTVVVGAASKLALSGSTADLTAGATRVLTATIQDASGNTITTGASSTLSVTFAKTAGTGTVTGLGSVNAVAGVATLTVTGNQAGPVTITASATGLTAGTGNPITFNIVADVASKIALSGATGNLASGITRQLTATIQDSSGNTITSGPASTSSVTFAKTTGTGDVSGLASVNAVAGVANITVTGTTAGSVTIAASVGGLAAGTGNPITFNVVTGALDHFAISTISSPQTAGAAFSINITAQDFGNNTVASFSAGNNKVMLTSNPTGLTGAPITTIAFTNGVLTNQSVAFGNPGTFTILAQGISGNSGITGTSNSFDVNPSTVATTLVLNSVSPNSVTYGSAGPVTFTATLTRTSGGAAVSGATVNFTVDGNAAGSGVTNGSGVATFTAYNPSALLVASHNVQASFTATTISSVSYLGSTSSTLPLAVTKATPMVTLSVTNSPQTYTGSGLAAVVAITTSSVPGTVHNILTGGAATQTNAGTFAVTADFVPNDTANYNTVTGVSAGNFVIDMATPTATLTVSNSPQTYNGSPKSASVSVSTSSVPGSVANILTGGTATQTNAGTYAVTADFVPTDSTNYKTLTGLSAGNLVIDKATPTATLKVTNSPVTYNGNGQAATVAVDSSSVPGTIANVLTGGAATQTNAGTYVVTADFVPSDSSNYSTLTALSAGNFVISKANATVVVTPYISATTTYDGNPHTATYTITGVNGETGAIVGIVDVSHTTHTDAGTYAIDYWFFTGGTNYNDIGNTTITDSIAKANATVVITPYTSATTTYDGDPHTATYTITGVNGETGAIVGLVNVSHTTHTDAGTYATDYWFFTGGTNYNDIGNTTITDSIGKANATVVVTPYTSADTTYDGNEHTATVTSMTGVHGETGGTVGTVDVSHTTHKDAGTYSTDYWFFTGTANYNDIGNTTITDSIAKANATVVVTPYTNATTTYDGNPHTATVTSITGVNTETGNTVGTVDVSHTTHTNAGTYSTDYWTFTGTANYNDIGNTTITDSIDKANATVVVTPYTSLTTIYDGHSHTAAVTSIIGVNGETGATVGTVDVTNTTHTNAGTYSADYWFFTGGINYNNIGNTTITDSIAKANATVVVTAYTSLTTTYDGNPHSATVTSITGVNGETGAIVGTVDVSHTTHINAGSFSTDYWTFTGGMNYNNIGATTITDSIAKANATVVVTAYTSVNTTYNANPHTATVTSITGVHSETGATVGSVDVSHTTHTDAGTYSTDYWFFTGTANYNDIGNTTITDSIAKANQTITWATPAVITVGTPLGGTQLNATVAGVAGGTLPGALTYTPPAGTVLPAGATQTLRVDAAATINYNTAYKTVSINVNYTFVGFLSPIDNLPIVNSVKAGQTIPVKWQLKDAAGNLINDLGSLAASGLQSVRINCDGTATTDPIEELAAPGATLFRFDGTQFIFNWQTTKSWAGTCRLMTVTLKDGNVYSAQFTFK